MRDVQNQVDARGIAIQHVGIRDAHLPFLIKTKDGGFQSVLARIQFTVELPEKYKGTHMSRFLEILTPWSQKPLAEPEMDTMLEDALRRLDAQAADVELAFKYFVEKKAPVSGRMSLLDYDCRFVGRKQAGEPLVFTLGVDVPFTSLCPCSKEISDYGAHNQRSICRVRVRFAPGHDCILIEDLASLVEAQGSSPIYPLLKRADEKYVTEAAYDNPKFVEDILRDNVLALRKLDGIAWFSVECENFESIHNHNAYASHEENVQ
ncbi:MAG: GTP cyclohydrolase FolE2 [Veillonellaceae bacterium]|uniref:GTP cyclohydrolase FolE2 n=1 Tax=uncultured Selenomonas sp. TaxID=159275 RepID=UPI0025CE39D3|nr:GTP cyclohydrolase FolE2 [uncultured Selenomonas sp.]MCI7539382.1 GTP cyclohydrolase FolE2 [Veillonellaceae bacterium]MDD6128743.1 GTP cyclohydrolase FolE2 [Veillonellaceae bacterium]